MCPFMVRYKAATLTCEIYCRHFYFFGNHVKFDIFRQPLTVRFSLLVISWTSCSSELHHMEPVLFLCSVKIASGLNNFSVRKFISSHYFNLP